MMLRAIGLMSGTSMDGVDIAMIETDGEGRVASGPFAEYAYSEADRALLRGALADAVNLTDRHARPMRLGEAEAVVTARHIEAVRGFVAANGIDPQTVDVVGFHGQTVLHRPQDRLTVQIGDGPALARSIGLRVVHDLRAADVAAGGQGAPLVPVYHRALIEARGLRDPVVVLNLGGVGNLTYVRAGADPIAFDTGPGNALIDDFMLARTGTALDEGGRVALSGKVDEVALSALVDHPYLAQVPPKSLDRNAFSISPVGGLSTPDGAATLAAFTAASVARALDHLPAQPSHVVVSGGGARNGAILRELAMRLPAVVVTADDWGWSAAAMEAQAFAYLAVRSLKRLPLTFPTTTGVPTAMTGGVLAKP